MNDTAPIHPRDLMTGCGIDQADRFGLREQRAAEILAKPDAMNGTAWYVLALITVGHLPPDFPDAAAAPPTDGERGAAMILLGQLLAAAPPTWSEFFFHRRRYRAKQHAAEIYELAAHRPRQWRLTIYEWLWVVECVGPEIPFQANGRQVWYMDAALSVPPPFTEGKN